MPRHFRKGERHPLQWLEETVTPCSQRSDRRECHDALRGQIGPSLPNILHNLHKRDKKKEKEARPREEEEAGEGGEGGGGEEESRRKRRRVYRSQSSS